MAERSSEEFSPRPFVKQATPTCSDSSDREAPVSEANQEDGEFSTESKTLTAEDEEDGGRVGSGHRTIRANSTDSHTTTTSNSPKSGHESSEFSEPSGDGSPSNKYRKPIEATTKHPKGRRKKQSSTQPLEEAGILQSQP